jgi:hypothetical protein
MNAAAADTAISRRPPVLCIPSMMFAAAGASSSV